MSLKDTDVRTPGDAAIAKKWKLSLSKVRQLVKQGAEHEKEHNSAEWKAEEVARDHINERPDYYSMLKKAEKSKIKLKENTHTGVASVSDGTAKGSEEQYKGTNMMSYEDGNGDKLQYLEQAHIDHHNKALGFNHFNPTEIRTARNHHLKANTIIQETTTARIKVKSKLNELGELVKTGTEDYKNASSARTTRTNDQLEEGPLKDKAKKVAMAGMTAANMYTMADVMSRANEGGHGSPKSDIVKVASALPGAAGWGATAIHYGKKGYDLAKDVIKKKKAHMEEEKKMSNPCWKGYKAYGMKKKNGKEVPNCVPVEEQEASAARYTERPTYESAAWQRSAGKDPEGGLNRKGIASYRREHPGSKLSMAVTTKPSKLDPDSKPAKRRKSFCARMGGMKGPMKDEKDRPTRKALALRKWNCEEETQINELSKKTLNSYIKKSGEDLAGDDGRQMYMSDRKLLNRDKGHSLAKAKAGITKYPKVMAKEDNKYPDTAERGIYEKHLTPAETKKKEEIVMSMKKGLPGMKKRYGERAKEVLYATATKRAKQVAEEQIKEDGFDLDAVTHAVRSKESKNDYGAKSKSSSASGAYQYINKTWKGSASKYGVDTKQFPTAKSAPKEVQDKVFTNDLQKNASKYGSLEKAVNVHYTGNPGGKVSAAGLKANRGQTGGGYMSDIKKRVDDYNTERKSTMGAAQQMSANFSGGSKSLSTPDSTQFAKAPEAPKPTQVASAPETPKLQNPDQNITKVASTPAPTQVSQTDTKDKKPTQVASLNELKAETLGSYIKKASASRKKSLKGSNADIKTWGKRQKGITTAIKQLTKHEETKMNNNNLINEAIENIIENDLTSMKDNLMFALQEKAQEKLDERKKEIAANYFAQ
jgi:hypothetical protein